MSKFKAYVVKFDTQRNKVYSNWEFITCATSKKRAIEEAQIAWTANGNKAHMFHLEAEVFNGDCNFCDFKKFKRVDWKPVTWGVR